MIDPEILMLKALAEALDESGVSPEADEDEAKSLVEALSERGYEITKTAPAVPSAKADDDTEC